MNKSKEEDDTREETGCAKALRRKRVWEQKKAQGDLRGRCVAAIPDRALWALVSIFSFFWSTVGSS